MRKYPRLIWPVKVEKLDEGCREITCGSILFVFEDEATT